MNFGRSASSCPAFSTGEAEKLDAWKIESLGRYTTEFQLDMGQAGGEQGFEGITGKFCICDMIKGNESHVGNVQF